MVKRWKHSENITDAPRAGRAHKLTPSEEKAVITKAHRKKRHSLRAIASEVSPQVPGGSTRTTIGNILHRNEHKFFHTTSKNQHTTNQKLARLRFCTAYKDYDWNLAVFIDESPFPLYAPPNRHNTGTWAKKNPHLTYPKKPNVRGSLSVLGAICMGGQSKLIFYEGSLNAEKYINLLDKLVRDIKKNLLPGAKEWTLFQDNAPPHKAKDTQKWLAKNVPNFCHRDDWPGTSPDFNPAENIWGIIEDVIRANPPNSVAQLRKKIIRTWNSISPDDIQSCILSMPSRLAECKANGGGDTKY